MKMMSKYSLRHRGLNQRPLAPQSTQLLTVSLSRTANIVEDVNTGCSFYLSRVMFCCHFRITQPILIKLWDLVDPNMPFYFPKFQAIWWKRSEPPPLLSHRRPNLNVRKGGEEYFSIHKSPTGQRFEKPSEYFFF